MRRRRRPLVGDLPLPKHPFRDSAVFNAVLALIIVGVAWATDGPMTKAIAFAVVFYAAATAWSWWRFRKRLEVEPEGEAPRR
jgi:membrane protein implicated in regulation of membrane protease activity